MEFLTLVDFILPPLYLAIIYYISRMIQNRKIVEFPEYKYYIKALSVKLFAGIIFCLVYILYYKGGDTTQYFTDSVIVNRLLFKDPALGYDVIFHGLDVTKISYFDSEIGYPAYFREASTSFIVQVTSVLSLIGFRSFLATTLIVSYLSFQGLWNLYRVFLTEFPHLGREMAIAILFIPSTLFWGSGILKDTFSLSAVGYFTYSFYNCFIRRKNVLKHLIVMILAAMVIIKVKAYIFMALLPGVLIWLGTSLLSRISGKMLKAFIGPFTILIFLGSAYGLITFMGDSLGKFSAEQILDRAVVTQRDLKSDYYGGSAFDIGEFDNTFSSILQVSHRALFAGLFRPFILEANHLMMFISALENFFLLWLFVTNIYKARIFGFFRFFVKDPLLTFSLIFSLFFAFSVGLSTSNFGSLVRYKIPLIPFFVAAMFIIRDYLKKEKAERITKDAEIILKPI